MKPSELFNKYNALHVKDAIPRELSFFITRCLSLKRSTEPSKGDSQIPNALAVESHTLYLDAVLEAVWPKIEAVVEEELIPTYAYSRLYSNGDVLEKHTDRPSCEISVTIQLGRSHHYVWPIFMGGMRFDMAECDGVIYKGCDIEHWRDACNGPDGYYSAQLFLHYVRAKGPYADFACDKRWDKNPFIRFRAHEAYTK